MKKTEQEQSWKRKMIDDFEKNYGFEKEAERQISYLPPHDIAAMRDDVQEEFKQKVMVELMKHRECTPWNVQRAMASKIYDLSDLIDIREHMERIEEESRKKAEQSRRVKMIKIVIGITVAAVWITFFALAKETGMVDRRLEEIKRLTAEREVGIASGN